MLAALLTLTYYPDMPHARIRVRGEWFRLDYIGHLGFYAALTASFLIWRSGWRKKVPVKLLLLTILVGLVFGIITEFTQSLVPGRFFNPFDMIYNCAGVLTGTIGVYLIRKREDGKNKT
ncbi:MAG: VanZ family protein [Bacteroidales bacterium]|nr:VanZ family protein [Bacteroidales bacterium]